MRILAWFVAVVFMLLTSVAVSKIVFGPQVFPHVSIWCIYNWYDQGCSLLSQDRAEIPVIAEKKSSETTSHSGPINDETWISINRFAPWTIEQATSLGQQLEEAGWDVKSSQFPAIPAADGKLEVRFSDKKYQEDAVRLAKDLNSLIKPSQMNAIRVFDLSETKWKDTTNPMHLEVWIGKK
nr:hypothetical protein [uncultured Cohaesibacter sp.]